MHFGDFLKIVYSDKKTGRSAQAEVSEEMKPMLLNRKIGETIDGAVIGLGGYKLQITGGSSKSGFPMEGSLAGTGKSKVLKLMGTSGANKGVRTRKTVVGPVISDDTEQVNAVITEYGSKPIDEVLPVKEKAKKEAPEGEEAK